MLIVLSLRMKESRKQADVMGKMQAMIRDLQATKQTGDQRLLEAEDEAKSQSRRAESRERTLQEVYSTLLAYEKRCGNNLYTSQDALGVAVEKVLHDLEHANHSLRESLLLVRQCVMFYFTQHFYQGFEMLFLTLYFPFLTHCAS